MTEIDLYGPPGTGKTTRLTQIGLKALETISPNRIGAVTYTRAAATELRGRLAAALGLRVPENPQAARRVLDANLPWVGTIHSLCYKLIGRPPTINGKDLAEFARAMDPSARTDYKIPSNPDDLEGYEFGDIQSHDEVELALQLHAMARHRLVPIADAVHYLSDQARMEINLYRIETIARLYEGFKTEVGKIDFEDMLMLGADADLPVSVMLCDEVQDNSALLWRTIDAWASRTNGLTVMAGDPWQAIYVYSGAEPGLFRNRSGQWITIGNSHRLSASTAAFALSLLRHAGYQDDSLLSTWEGIGGQPKDGTSFYLARTNNLLLPVRQELETAGEPYRLLRGTGPLQTNAAKAYRAVWKDGDNPTVATAALVAASLPPKSGTLPHGTTARWSRLAAESPNIALSIEDSLLLNLAVQKLPHIDYFSRVMGKYGVSGFVLQPKISVGTIHAAKGREADTVNLVRSWGYLPGRRIYEGGRLEEACVAYVGSTRHRSGLRFLYFHPGIEYPFPPLAED